MDNRTAQRAGSSYQPTRSILKPSRSSHTQSSARQKSRSPPSHPARAVQIVDPPTRPQTQTQAIRSIAAIPQHGPIPEITFPAVHNAEQLEQLEQLALEFTRQIQARRRQLELIQKSEARAQTPPPPPPPPSPPAGRPKHTPDDYPEFRDILMGPWHAGADYGPVLDPEDAMKLPQLLRVNPHICTTGDGPLVHWDVTQPPTSAVIIHPDGHVVPFDEFRHEPATVPRLTEVKTISRLMPYDWLVSSECTKTGVTIGDLIVGLSRALPFRLSEATLNTLDEERKSTAIRTYRARCSDNEGGGPQIHDLLAGNTLFGGWIYDPVYEQERNFYDKYSLNILVSYLPNTSNAVA